MMLCHNPRASRWLVLWWVVFVLATISGISMVGGFVVLRCAFPALMTTIESATRTTTIRSQHRPQYGMVAKNNNDVAGWIQRMTNYLSSEKDAIFAGKNVAMILDPWPSRECLEIASVISGIASEADQLCFVVSPQNDEKTNNGDDDNNNEEISFSNFKNSINSKHNEMHSTMVESIDFDDNIDTEAIDVVILSTKSTRVVEDSFVNDFLRRTDAWIHMGSEFADDFCLHARLQEGANITLW